MRNEDQMRHGTEKGVVAKVENGALRWSGATERMDVRSMTKKTYMRQVKGRRGGEDQV